MKKPILSLLLILTSHYLFSQTFFGVASVPNDNAAQPGPTPPSITPPALMQAGDLVVIFGEYRATGATFSINQAGGQTWNTIAASNVNNQTTAIFWCTFNGTWSANPSIKVASGTNGLTSVMYVFRPTASGFSWRLNIGPNNGTTAGGATNTITGITPTASNTVTMAFWNSASSTNTWGTLTGTGTGWSKTGLGAQYRNTTTGQSHSAAYNIQTTGMVATGNTSQTQGGTATAGVSSIICFNQIPNNDVCANATLITTDPNCINGTSRFINQTLNGANADGGTITSGCTAMNQADVWYKFVAQTKYPIITVSNFGANWTNKLKIQLLSGTCGAFSEVGCGNNTVPATSFPIMPTGNGLTVGNTYYIRILKNNAGTPTGGPASWNFDICVTEPPSSTSSRMNEVFKQTILSGPNVLLDPWEVTYGPDDKLWITEAKGYKVYRMDPVTGTKTTVLDISQGSTFLPPADQIFNCQFANGSGVQGGLAGLALHPRFLAASNPVNYAYVSYVYKQDSASVLNASCTFWKNRVVRFTYNTGTGKFESPVSLCDTLPGGNDHNSQRMIIKKVGTSYYLFYASGDLGAGQLNCRDRVQKAQIIGSYEGKILRFNLDTDGDNATLTNLNNWIPNDNPYNAMLGKQSAVWATGIRNNQGFACDTVLNILYGSSHGPYSDDEINIIEPFRNYGHPLVIGYASDGNYNGTTTPGVNTSVSAGNPFAGASNNNGISANPAIGNEMTRKAAIDAAGQGAYKDPLFSAYAAPNGDVTTPGTIKYIWATNPGNANPPPGWPSEAWSGLDIYTNTLIPGWHKSLVASSLKWGRLVRIRLAPSGTITVPSNDPILNAGDTISYFGSTNRFRDVAFAPNGKDIYVIMDRSTTTSGPSAQWPVIPACLGCVQKYEFLGYRDNGGKSTIPAAIDVTTGTTNTIIPGTTVTIDASNNTLWVPITGPDGNIMAEINAMGQSLGVVTSAFYKNSGAIRIKNGFHYLDRNITITPAVNGPYGTQVKVRLYLSKAEFDALDADPGSGITGGISQLKILKNEDPIGAAVLSSTTEIPVTISGPDLLQGTNGYVLQGDVSDFSSFYFGALNITLPLELVYFRGALQNNATMLQWETINENSSSHFDVERSLDGRSFDPIGSVTASNTAGPNKYAYVDHDVNSLPSSVIYYRLKMVDIDGQYKYSNVVTIYRGDVTTMKVAPNPTTGETKLTINAITDGTVILKIRDNSGRVVMHNAVQLRKGINNVNFNIGHLSRGLYFLNVSGEGISENIKLQKL